MVKASLIVKSHNEITYRSDPKSYQVMGYVIRLAGGAAGGVGGGVRLASPSFENSCDDECRSR